MVTNATIRLLSTWYGLTAKEAVVFANHPQHIEIVNKHADYCNKHAIMRNSPLARGYLKELLNLA